MKAQLQRLLASGRFRGKKIPGLLKFLVDEWIEDLGAKLTLRYIGECLQDEPLTYEEESLKWGYPKTKSNLNHVRKRLKAYYETQGYRDPVIIKLNVGSYTPVVAYNPITTGIADLEPEIAKLVLRAKTCIDLRSIRSAQRAMHYLQRIPLSVTNPRQMANLIFIPMAAAAIIPSSTLAMKPHLEFLITKIKSSGTEPWESIFTEACAEACYRHEWQKSLALFKVSITASQGEATYLWWYTALLASQGRSEEAIEILERAVAHFSRTNIATRTDLALLQIMSGKFSDAEEILSGTLDFAGSENALLSCHFAMLYEAQDRISDAILSVVKVSESGPEMSANLPYGDGYILISGLLALLAGRAGASEAASAMLATLLQCKANRPPASSVDLALAFIGLGRYDEAVQWLDRAAFEESDPMAMWFHILPPLRHLRAHAGFKELLKRLNLPLPRNT